MCYLTWRLGQGFGLGSRLIDAATHTVVREKLAPSGQDDGSAERAGYTRRVPPYCFLSGLC